MFQKIGKILHILYSTQKKQPCRSIFFKKKYANTPTYLIIAKDLENPHEQIFEGAVYYLCKIAKLKKTYYNDIKKILTTYINSNPEKTIRSAYVKKMLEKNLS